MNSPTGRAVRAAVIGSGFGGLAVALRLVAMGVQTVIFEARDQPGGSAYVYREHGFAFDAGPTVITAPDCLEELFALFGRSMSDSVELLPVQPFYRLLWSDGDSFDYIGDCEGLLNQIRRHEPDDAEGYLRFVDYSRRVFDKGYTQLAATPFLRFWDMVKVAPSLAALRADRSVYATVSRFLKNEKLRQAFSFHALLVGGDPFSASAIYTLIHYLERKWGVFFPRGGTGTLIAAFARLFADAGGELRLSSPVRSIALDSGNPCQHWVTTDGHSREPFDLVVSNANLMTTYATLYAGDPHADAMASKLRRMRWSMSLVVIYFGTDRRYENLAHHTVLFGPRYRELLRDIFHGPELAGDFSLYLHAPRVTDPAMAPDGCDAFYVLCPVPNLGTVRINWDEFGPHYADRILASLERHLPKLRQHIVAQRLVTPLDFQRDLSAHLGSAFSLSPLLSQSAYFRPHNRDRHIPGLYLVGAGTHPGAGVPGVVNSAKATASIIQKDFSL